MLRALWELGIACDVVTYPIGRDPELPGARVLRASNPLRIRSVPVGFSFRKLALDISLWHRARRAFRNGRYVAIQASEEAAFLAVILARGTSLPVIYDMQSSLPEQMAEWPLFRIPLARWALDRCERWLANRVDIIFASAGLGTHAESVVMDTPVREWSFHAEDHPVSPEDARTLRRELGIPVEAPLVLYTGTFAPYQGLRTLVDAVPRVLAKVPDAVFVMVGAEKPLAELFPDVDVPVSAIRVVPRQAREEMRRYYRMADVLVSPRATGRNLPLKIFDYLGSGKPIVATDVHAHRAVLDDHLALMVRPDALALAEGIRRILQDEALRSRYREASQTFARQRLGWEPFVRNVRSNYSEIIDVGSPGETPP